MTDNPIQQGEALKQEGIARSYEKGQRDLPDWRDEIVKLFYIDGVIPSEFTSESLRVIAEKRGIELPEEARSFGGIMKHLQSLGLAKPTGIYKKGILPQCHRGPKQVWERAGEW